MQAAVAAECGRERTPQQKSQEGLAWWGGQGRWDIDVVADCAADARADGEGQEALEELWRGLEGMWGVQVAFVVQAAAHGEFATLCVAAVKDAEAGHCCFVVARSHAVGGHAHMQQAEVPKGQAVFGQLVQQPGRRREAGSAASRLLLCPEGH